MSAATVNSKYKDTWRNVQFNPPYDVQDVIQEFQVKKSYYANHPKINEYAVSLYGIDNNSIIKQNQMIRIYCDVRVNYSTLSPQTDYRIDYMVLMNNQVYVIPWSPVDQMVLSGCKEDSFALDTSWLLDNQTYQILLRINEMGTSRILEEKLTFKVIREF